MGHLWSLEAPGTSFVDLANVRNPEEAVRLTLEAMRNGADVVSQGALQVGQWYGRPDVLEKVAVPSAFGEWSYEVADTKLARETAAGTILQLGLYGELLETVQAVRAAVPIAAADAARERAGPVPGDGAGDRLRPVQAPLDVSSAALV
jgi:predicted RecB family nuclease